MVFIFYILKVLYKNVLHSLKTHYLKYTKTLKYELSTSVLGLYWI